MPKKTSVKSLAIETVSTTTPVVENVVPPVTVEKKPRKTKSTTATTAPVETTVPVETAPVETTGSENLDLNVATTTDIETTLNELSNEFIGKMQQISTLISALKVDYKTLEKKWSREVKVAQKLSNKRKRKASNRAPSGFVKPTQISDELASFLGKDKGVKMARTDVTREINTYIRANNLQDKENGRKINPDGKLSQLLRLKNTDELTYFNLQKYMSPHFAKATKAEDTPVVTA